MDNTEQYRNGNNQIKTNRWTSFLLQNIWKQFTVETLIQIHTNVKLQKDMKYKHITQLIRDNYIDKP